MHCCMSKRVEYIFGLAVAVYCFVDLVWKTYRFLCIETRTPRRQVSSGLESYQQCCSHNGASIVIRYEMVQQFNPKRA